MQTIVVANPKGGSGKTTLATHVAGWLAAKRQRVALQDLDPQRSSAEWLERRPELFPRIFGVPPAAKSREVKDNGAQWLVVDTPAGLHGEEAATQHFLAAIRDYKAVRKGELAIGIVAMRVDARTLSAAELDEFLKSFEFPVVAHLRDTQVYVHCARDGASVFDLPRSRGEQDWEQWRPLTRWIGRNAPARQT
jgi:chromosome partitioning protein